MNPARGAELSAARRPALVLGLGNLLLTDDALGLTMLECVRAQAAGLHAEFVDGGTQGLALLGWLSDRPALLLLDAVGRGSPPGTVHVLDGPQAMALRFSAPASAHEGGAGSLLATAQLTGDLPEHVVVVGVEPELVATGMGLTPRVEAALPEAVRRARVALEVLLSGASAAEACARSSDLREVAPCTS